MKKLFPFKIFFNEERNFASRISQAKNLFFLPTFKLSFKGIPTGSCINYVDIMSNSKYYYLN